MMDIKGLFVWIGDTSDPTDLNTKKTICLGNNRILTIARITWITRFLVISHLDQFCSNYVVAQM